MPDLPAGMASLSKRQQHWVLEYLRTGNATEAARLAGYSSPESDGAKVRKTAGVVAILQQIGAKVARNADQLVLRASERSRALHAMVQAELAKPETTRSMAQLLKLVAAADRTDTLLGSLLGKITGVHVTNEVHHHGAQVVQVPAEALPGLAQLRRSVLEDRRAQQPVATGGQN